VICKASGDGTDDFFQISPEYAIERSGQLN
jgi:hypothetical protein